MILLRKTNARIIADAHHISDGDAGFFAIVWKRDLALNSKYCQLAYSTHRDFLGGKLQVVGPERLSFLEATAETVFPHSFSERLNVVVLRQLLQSRLIPYFIIIRPISIVGQ